MKYLQNWLMNFYPERMDIVKQAQQMAKDLGGHLEVPRFSWKYSWIEPIFGPRLAKRAQASLPLVKWSLVRFWDKALCHLETRSLAGILGT